MGVALLAANWPILSVNARLRRTYLPLATSLSLRRRATTDQYLSVETWRGIDMSKIARFCLVGMIALYLSGCSFTKPPAHLDVRMEKPSGKGVYAVTMHPTAAAPLNQIHTWEIAIRNSVGQPVDNARIKLSGGMPQHFHSFPTKPEVTEALGGGRYLLDGVKFSMTGWWEFRLAIDSDRGEDTVSFNRVVTEQGTLLDEPGAK
jgi:hypothetical protein